MKSYRMWKEDESFRKDVLPILEATLKSFFGGPGLSGSHKQEMGRIGQMLGQTANTGFGSSKWGKLGKVFGQGAVGRFLGGKDDAHLGHDFMTQINQGNVSELLKQASGNSPFRQAYDAMNKIKQTIPANKGDLQPEEIKLLMQVLTNSHKAGEVPVDALNQLWRGVTGIMDHNGNVVDQDAAQRAKANDVHTPVHLLKNLFGIGGGMFSAPANLGDIKNKSAEILRAVYPDEFNQLFQRRYHQTPAEAGLGGQQQPQAQQSGNQLPPNFVKQLTDLVQRAKNAGDKTAGPLETLLQQLQGGGQQQNTQQQPQTPPAP